MITAEQARERSDEHKDFQSALCDINIKIIEATDSGLYIIGPIPVLKELKPRIIRHFKSLGYGTGENMVGQLFIQWS